MVWAFSGMKILIINERRYRLPNDTEVLRRVLNHIEMCRTGKKSHARLINLDTEETETVSATELKTAQIDII